jgi:hypothetical protein
VEAPALALGLERVLDVDHADDRLGLEGLEAIRNEQFELRMKEEARGAQGN